MSSSNSKKDIQLHQQEMEMEDEEGGETNNLYHESVRDFPKEESENVTPQSSMSSPQTNEKKEHYHQHQHSNILHENENFENEHFEETSSSMQNTNKWVESIEHQSNDEEDEETRKREQEEINDYINSNLNKKFNISKEISVEAGSSSFHTPSSSMNDIVYSNTNGSTSNKDKVIKETKVAASSEWYEFELCSSNNSGENNSSIHTNPDGDNLSLNICITNDQQQLQQQTEANRFSTGSSYQDINAMSASYSDLTQSVESNISITSKDSNSKENYAILTPPNNLTPNKDNLTASNSISSSKPKKKSWYNVFSTSYKTRSNDFKKIFNDLPPDERLIVDYSCALQKDILIQGRMYVSQNHISFYANIFGWETQVSIKFKDISSITKEKTALVIPNAIQVISDTEKCFFSSFVTRDSTYLMLFKLWQNSLIIKESMSSKDIWKLIHSCYGEDITTEEETEEFLTQAAHSLMSDMSPCSISMISNDENFENKSMRLGIGIEQDEIYNAASIALGVALGSVGTPLLPKHQQQILTPDQYDEKDLIQQTTTVVTSDQSDSSDSEDDEKEKILLPITPAEILSPISPLLEIPECPFDHTLGKETVNTVINTNVDQLFTMLFTNSKFYLDLHTSRKTFDIVLSPWSETENKKMRQVSFTVTLNHLMGPKHSQVTETQTMLPESVPGLLYAIDCESVNSGIPYADSFYVTSHFCLARVSNTESRLRIVNQIKYKKSVWGMKSFIEKNSWAGILEFYNHLERALKEECSKVDVYDLSPTSSPKKVNAAGLTRRKGRKKGKAPPVPGSSSTLNNLSSGVVQNGLIPNSNIIEKSSFIAKASQTITEGTFILKIILTILSLLILLNGFLYYKLTILESSTTLTTPFLFPQKSFTIANNEMPQNHQEWLLLLQQQESLHRLEMEKWHEILVSALKILHKAEGDLESLKSHITVYGSGKFNLATGKLKVKEKEGNSNSNSNSNKNNHNMYEANQNIYTSKPQEL